MVSSCEWLAELRGFETCQVISIHAASGVLVSPSVLDAEIYRQMDPLCFHFLWCVCLCCVYYLAHLEKIKLVTGRILSVSISRYVSCPIAV